jgi:hypothetical protein
LQALQRVHLRLQSVQLGYPGFLIEQIQKERNRYFDQLLTASRKVGELETKPLQLESGNPDPR